jgi:hypothetical protein
MPSLAGHGSSPESFRLRPILSQTASLSWANALPLLLIAALTQGPWVLLLRSGVVIGTELERLLYSAVFTPIQLGAIVWLIDGALRGERRDVRTCLGRGVRRYPTLLSALLLAFLSWRVAAWIATAPDAFPAVILAPQYIVILASCAVALPVGMLGDEGIVEAISRSCWLMNGRRVTAILAMAVLCPTLAIEKIALHVHPWVFPDFGSWLMGAAATPFVVLLVVLYAAAGPHAPPFRRPSPPRAAGTRSLFEET